MAANIITTGTGLVNSSDVVIAPGSSLAVALKGTATARALVLIQLYDGAAYNTVGTLSTPDKNSTLLSGPGTYRFQRPASSGICGVFSG